MKKGWIIGGVCGVLLVILLMVAVLAAGVGKEASVMHDLMERDMSQHALQADVLKQLSDNGYSVGSKSPKVTAEGPVHSILVYSTHLTLEIGFDDQGKMNSYHLDRV